MLWLAMEVALFPVLFKPKLPLRSTFLCTLVTCLAEKSTLSTLGFPPPLPHSGPRRVSRNAGPDVAAAIPSLDKLDLRKGLVVEAVAGAEEEGMEAIELVKEEERGAGVGLAAPRPRSIG